MIDEPSSGGLTYSQSPQGAWDVHQAEFTLKADAVHHRQVIDSEKHTHNIDEARKDNNQRRRQDMILFIVVIGIIVAGLVYGAVTGIWGENDTIRTFGQGIVTLLLGTVAGGLAGFFRGQRGK